MACGTYADLMDQAYKGDSISIHNITTFVMIVCYGSEMQEDIFDPILFPNQQLLGL